MSDLSEVQASVTTKVVGSDASGVETYPVSSTPSGDLCVSDGISSGGVQGNLSLALVGTAYEAKVGTTRLANRKLVTVYAVDTNVYWGYNNTVTSNTGTPIAAGSIKEFKLDPSDPNAQIWLATAAAAKNARITESP